MFYLYDHSIYWSYVYETTTYKFRSADNILLHKTLFFFDSLIEIYCI